MAPRWRSRIWPCSCLVTFSSTNWPGAAKKLNILGATSGDTGSAAEYAMRGKTRRARVHDQPGNGRMSPFQQAQMFSLMDANIHNIAVEGVFDDCQDMVKAVSNDLDFKRKLQDRHGQFNQLGKRLMAQVVYYFAGYFPGDARATLKKCLLQRSIRQLRQCLCRARCAHDGLAD
jgi:threonine synthase